VREDRQTALGVDPVRSYKVPKELGGEVDAYTARVVEDIIVGKVLDKLWENRRVKAFRYCQEGKRGSKIAVVVVVVVEAVEVIQAIADRARAERRNKATWR
jgi:hypothetical protein